MAENTSYGDVLNSIISNPDTMNNVMQMAKKLMEGQNGISADAGNQPESDIAENTENKSDDGAGDNVPGIILKNLIDGDAAHDRERLLTALRPYLSAERREIVDTVLRLFRLAKLAERAGKLDFNVLTGKTQ